MAKNADIHNVYQKNVKISSTCLEKMSIYLVLVSKIGILYVFQNTHHICSKNLILKNIFIENVNIYSVLLETVLRAIKCFSEICQNW